MCACVELDMDCEVLQRSRDRYGYLRYGGAGQADPATKTQRAGEKQYGSSLIHLVVFSGFHEFLPYAALSARESIFVRH